MPNRIIKESINESKGLSQCSFVVQDFYKRLITYADDYGRFNADIEIMRARLYPRELDIVKEEHLVDWMIELIGIGKIVIYTSELKKEVYGHFPNWADHQRLRDSKERFPAPDDTEINDIYLRRFVPLDMKAEILIRDDFKCHCCRKYLTTCTDAMSVVKLGTGLFHFDLIIPISQGGSATVNNLRLTCVSCGGVRQKSFSVDELRDISTDSCGLQKVAASCGELRPESESESEKKKKPKRAPGKPVGVGVYGDLFDRFWKEYPRKTAKAPARKAFEKQKPDEKLLGEMLKALDWQSKTEQWMKDGGTFIPYASTWLNQRRWEDEKSVNCMVGKEQIHVEEDTTIPWENYSLN